MADVADRRPTSFSGLAEQWRELLSLGQQLTTSTTTNSELMDWYQDFQHAWRWAEECLNKLDPVRASRVNWGAQARGATMSEIYYGALGLTQVLWHQLSAWADADVKFAPRPPDEFVVFNAREPFSAWMRIEQLFESTHHRLFIADPYFNAQALRLLTNVGEHIDLRILARTDQAPTAAIWSRFQAERKGPSSYRRAPANEMTHDRILLVDDSVYLSGASLKDVGKKFSVLLQLENAELQRQCRTAFERIWATAHPL